MTKILDIATNLSTLTIILIAAAAALLLAVYWFVRRRRQRLYRDELPPLIFAVHDRIAAPPGMRPGVFHAPTSRGDGPFNPPAPSSPPPPYSAPAPAPPPAPPPPYPDGSSGRGGSGMSPTGGNGSSQRRAVEEVTVRVPRYEERTAEQYLPGRLEVQTAGDMGPGQSAEIRFPLNRSHDGSVILGRDDGPSGANVKLPAESVSRRHARMQFENGRWKISNLSRTNPTLVNGEELMVTEGARWLYDGDMIEMGEVVFRFHER